jgi:HrpA-like RNA helicase
LLQKLVHNPSYLGECSHLVLDEIHERGLDADILYVILKRILRALVKFDRDQGRPADLPSYPSLVMMSATFSTDLFGAYFCSVYKDIPAFRHYARSSSLRPICIETRRYPVSVFHLEDILNAPMLRGNAPMLNRLLSDNPASTLHGLVAKMSRPPPPSGGMGGGSAQAASSAALGPISNSLLHVISWLCSALALCHRSDPEDGNCVLVFFPGLVEIEAAERCSGSHSITDRRRRLRAQVQTRSAAGPESDAELRDGRWRRRLAVPVAG